MTDRETTILFLHKAGMTDSEILSYLASKGDKAALRYREEEADYAERYSDMVRLHDVEDSV